MFDKDRFIHECMDAVADGPLAIREIMATAVSDRTGMMAALGAPVHAGITPLHNAPQLTIIQFIWAPCMALIPHNHRMFGVVGIYSGREDNVYWRRTPSSIEAFGAESLGAGDVAVLEREAIHSVLNPLEKMTCAIHVYGGDFFHPREPRSEWDHETLVERPWNVDRARAVFRQAEERFNAARH
jgi:predicted metal-dependent enzyme (double-stranded beta helix superfamily)